MENHAFEQKSFLWRKCRISWSGCFSNGCIFPYQISLDDRKQNILFPDILYSANVPAGRQSGSNTSVLCTWSSMCCNRSRSLFSITAAQSVSSERRKPMRLTRRRATSRDQRIRAPPPHQQPPQKQQQQQQQPQVVRRRLKVCIEV